MSKKLPLYRILQNQGFGTRKGCQLMIEEGDVSVAGAVITKPKAEFDPAGLVFSVFDEEWLYREHLYIALNKPANYECSRKPSHHPGVHTLLPEQFTWREVQPVGRLDHDTTGLLLLSDDGAFIHAQSHPKHHQPKVYVATLAQPADSSLTDQLLAGVQLHDEPAPLAAQVARLIDPLHVEIVIDQGKYHQVKRMLAAAGNHCAALARVQIGGLTLDALGLAEGEWCYLDAEQLAVLNRED
ncbi:16S rRNA pseudouridine516 synthase [Andreprevotia lacus DSM 23236]|jgi:16S rRNA pseudouridine516 synthase|uniref:Pseudouridine synthase n=1 Tax=Andreprevotia lacus DSM 23236 TaxID=1121001 RepID=A0A1W1XUK1_9NEIS|nr:16S rRNA pseudouridine(516) synthase [Andreprevotia lacus]SMC27535.1 16S rRNA pseudouridine516 synthase [Andreprevotia lacus DSM 23236]